MRRVICAFSVILALEACSRDAQDTSLPVLKLEWQQIREMPNNLVLRIENPRQTAVCLSDVDTKEGISFSQFGKAVEPFYFANRAILQWRGLI